jgi:hypothetical protein
LHPAASGKTGVSDGLVTQSYAQAARALLGGMTSAGGSADIPNRLLRAVSHVLACSSHRPQPDGWRLTDELNPSARKWRQLGA